MREHENLEGWVASIEAHPSMGQAARTDVGRRLIGSARQCASGAPVVGAADIIINAETSSVAALIERVLRPTIFPYLRDVRESGLMFSGARPASIWQCAALFGGRFVLRSGDRYSVAVDRRPFNLVKALGIAWDRT